MEVRERSNEENAARDGFIEEAARRKSKARRKINGKT